MTEKLTIRRPDDWHVHLRDEAMLGGVAPYTTRSFGRAIVMPNLVPPVTSVELAKAYRSRIMAALPEASDFTPLMTCYLTNNTDPADVRRGFEEGVYTAAKLYPAGATTNSSSGVTDLANIRGVLEVMAEIGMVLCVHGEVTDPEVDIFDREAVFIDQKMTKLVSDLPELKVVFEHLTSAEGVAFVENAGDNVAATITPQHLHINRNAMLVGGIRPHAYCLPVAKREKHRLELRRAATSGNRKFFLGTDSAPHTKDAKETGCGCAGIFNAPFALESYLAVFEAEDAIDKFEGFTSIYGPQFYSLPVSEETVTLERSGVQVPETIDLDGTVIVPFHAGEKLAWKLLS